MRRTAFASKAGIVGVWHQLNMGSQECVAIMPCSHEAARLGTPTSRGVTPSPCLNPLRGLVWVHP